MGLTSAAAAGAAGVGDVTCLASNSSPAPATAQNAPMQFGIYPGGTAGSVAGKPDARPEDPVARLAALQRLRAPGGTLGVHLYSAYTGDAAADARTSQWLDGEVSAYTAAGFHVELVMRYKPILTDTNAAVSGFADAMRETVDRYGADPGFTSLQVTNEANLPGVPAASDGAFPGAVRALVRGVTAAKDEVRRSGHAQVQIGFNWGSDARPDARSDFWAQLASVGDDAFRRSVDWVGLDSYPGTFYPALPLTSLLPGLTGTAVDAALHDLRACLMPVAGLGSGVAIHVSENGFPTGPGRTESQQADVLESMVRAVAARHVAYNVTSYNWFDLRDSRTDDANLESQYGLTRDDYTPKAAFGRYAALIAELGGPGAATAPTGGTSTAAAPACTRSPVAVRIPRQRGWGVQIVRIRRGARLLRTLRLRVPPTSVRVPLAPGPVRVSVRISGHRRGRAITRLVRRAYTVCAPSAA